jgi:hypothetical protein
MLNELDPQVKALLEQFQAKAAQHPAPALSAKEKIIALRQMMGASAARRYPSESVSRTSPYQVRLEKSPFVCMFLTQSFRPVGEG